MEHAWHDVVKECEKILELDGTAISPLSSALPNIIRDWKNGVVAPECVSHPAVEEDAESCCTREAGECILKDFGLCGHGCMYYAPALNFNREES